MRAALPVLLVLLALAGSAAAETIAVLDTGIDDDHPEVAGRVERRSFVTYAPLPGFPDPGQVEEDPDGHGTAAASVAAGATLGVAGEADLLDLQVDAAYAPAVDPATEQAAIAALDWLLANHGGAGGDGPRVALLSFASAGISADGAATIAAQAERLHAEGVALVVPAAAQPSALHDSPAVLTVAAAAGCDGAAAAVKPDLAAPADGLTVAQPGTAVEPAPTATASGSHLAAAQAAGAAARMWEARPDLPAGALYALLRATAQDTGPAGPDACGGFGTLDVERAEAAAASWEDPFVPEGDGERGTPGPPLLLVVLALMLAARRRR